MFVQNVCSQLKHKQPLKHARKMHATIWRRSEQDSSIKSENVYHNVPSGLCKGFIMNDSQQQFYE